MVRPDTIVEQLESGVRIGAATAQAAEIGRHHTKRTLPW
jgi:hypothetical protein